MKRLLLGCLAALAFAFPANAQTNKVGQQLVCDGANANTTTITVKDAAGATQTFDVVTGGTARCATVKAASTAAAATDPALVVAVSPNNTIAATQSGAWNITNITGTVSLPTGAATAANQQSITTWAAGTLGAMANYGTSPGAVLVPGMNAFITNSPSITNITGTVSLPTGAATAANQQSITTWAAGTLGAMANYGTSPGAVLVPGMNAFITNSPSITNITGTVSLPTGAATAANQTNATQKTQVVDGSGNIMAVKPASTVPVATDTAAVTTLSPNSPGIIPLGGSTSANSAPVVLASDQSAVRTTLCAPNPISKKTPPIC